MSRPLRPPSVENLLLLVRLSGGRYSYWPDQMAWNVAMPAPIRGLSVWKAVQISELELATEKGQDYVKDFINECLRANGERNG